MQAGEAGAVDAEAHGHADQAWHDDPPEGPLSQCGQQQV